MGLVKTLSGDVEYPPYTHEAQRLRQSQTSSFLHLSTYAERGWKRNFLIQHEKDGQTIYSADSTCTQK